MLRLFTSLFILVSFLGGSLAHAQGGKLQRVREEVRPQQPDNVGQTGDRSQKCADDDDGIDLSWLFSGGDDDDDGDQEHNGPPVTGLLAVLGSPFLLPAMCLEDHYSCPGYFIRYPYADNFPGSMWIDRARQFDREAPVKVWQGQLSIDYGNDFDGLNRTSGRLQFDTSSRFGILTSWNYFHESLTFGSDDMTIGDVNFIYRFAQNQVVQMRAGVGLRLLFDSYGSDYGVNFTYGADVVCSKPLIGSLVLDAGTLGDAGLFHVRGTLGVMLQRWELFGGYDFFRIGSTNLQGPLAGLRLWF